MYTYNEGFVTITLSPIANFGVGVGEIDGEIDGLGEAVGVGAPEEGVGLAERGAVHSRPLIWHTQLFPSSHHGHTRCSSSVLQHAVLSRARGHRTHKEGPRQVLHEGRNSRGIGIMARIPQLQVHRGRITHRLLQKGLVRES